jgi:hypothetical protein
MSPATVAAPADEARGGRRTEVEPEPRRAASRQGDVDARCVTAWPWAWCRPAPREAMRLHR